MMNAEHAIVALLPRGAGEEVHSTLIYFPAAIELFVGQVVQMMAGFYQPLLATVTEHAVLGAGDDDRVDVALIDGPLLRSLNAILDGYSIGNWGYTPHITKQPGQQLPTIGSWVTFDRIAVWNNASRTCWRFGSGERCAA